MKNPRVLLTGASGFQASFILQRLREKYDLTLFDRAAPREEFSDLPFLSGDITCYEDVAKACENQDAVVHLVALVRERFGQPASAYADVMVKGTWNIAQACVQQKVKRLVNISSVVSRGWPPVQNQAIPVQGPPNFQSGDLFYCLAKRLGEEIGDAYFQAHGLEVIHLRPAIIARDGLNNEPAQDQKEGFWFLHVDPLDVAKAVHLALETSETHGAFHIIATRPDALFDWRESKEKLGFEADHLWPEIPVARIENG